MSKKLMGIHHVTALTNRMQTIDSVMTDLLGLVPIHQRVNPPVGDDQTKAYGLFNHSRAPYLNFSYSPQYSVAKGGTNQVHGISLRVANASALTGYLKRFDALGIQHGSISEFFGYSVLPFETKGGLHFQLISDCLESQASSKQESLPDRNPILGLGPIVIDVAYYEEMQRMLQSLYNFYLVQKKDQMCLLEVGPGASEPRILLRLKDKGPQASLGAGAVHHFAFSVSDLQDLQAWYGRYQALSIRSSGIKDHGPFYSLTTHLGHFRIELTADKPL